MDAMREKRSGELFIFLHSILWALFPVIAKLTYDAMPPLASYAWGTLLAALFFAGIVLYRRKWHELRNPRLIWYAAMVAFFIGIMFYALYYIGLQFTTAGNVSIITLFEVFTSFLLFNVLRKENLSPEHALGALLMVAGAAVVLAPNFTELNVGDFIVLAATFFAPVGNLFQQKAREIASGESVMFLRYALTAPMAFMLAFALGGFSGAQYPPSALFYLVVNGVLILGLAKLFWVEGIHRISVTKGVALESVAPLLTLVFAWLILADQPTVWQLSSLVPLVIGVFLLTALITLRSRTLLKS